MKKQRLLRKYGVKSSDATVMAVTKRDAIFKFMNEGLGVTWPMIYEVEPPHITLERPDPVMKKRPEDQTG